MKAPTNDELASRSGPELFFRYVKERLRKNPRLGTRYFDAMKGQVYWHPITHGPLLTKAEWALLVEWRGR